MRVWNGVQNAPRYAKTDDTGFGQRVVMFDEGVILEEGTPDKVFSQAENERTRRFLNQLHWEGD